MATITSSGVGSGLDIESLVTQLVAAERAAPAARLDAKQASTETKLSAYGQITSALNAFKSAITKLNDATLFNAKKTTVSDGSILGATASASAKAGSYSVEVLQMAQGQRLITNATAEPAIGTGSLTFNINGSEHTVTLEDGQDTLAGLRDAINAAGIGVTASIVNNGKINQLVIASTAEGASSAFSITASGGLSDFAYDPEAPASGALATLDAAQDARLKVGGIEISRTSNIIDDAIEGVTLNLLDSKPGTTLRVSVSSDTEAAKTAITDMVTKYNEAMSLLKSLTVYTPAESEEEEAVAGVLQGDGTTRNLMQALRSTMSEGISALNKVLGMSVDDSKVVLGVAVGTDGMITLDTGKLDTALANSGDQLAALFSGGTGFASSMERTLNGYLDDDGILTNRTKSLDTSLSNIANEMSKLDKRMEAIEARYRSQFTAMDLTVASLNATSSYITQLIDSLSASRK